MCWTPVRSSDAVADVCWGYANNGKPFYYNTYGAGYAELYIGGQKCTEQINFVIVYHNMTAETQEIAAADMERVIEQAKRESASNTNSFKGSPFSPDVGPTWS